jgi:hypothetical protein
MRSRVSAEPAIRTILHQQPPADRTRNFFPDSNNTFATRAISMQARHTTSQRSSTRLRRLLSLRGSAGYSDVEHTVPKRHLTPGNQLVGGVFLHLTRKTPVVSCSPHFSQKLYHACYYKQVTGSAAPGMCTCIGYESIVLRCHNSSHKKTLRSSPRWVQGPLACRRHSSLWSGSFLQCTQQIVHTRLLPAQMAVLQLFKELPRAFVYWSSICILPTECPWLQGWVPSLFPGA